MILLFSNVKSCNSYNKIFGDINYIGRFNRKNKVKLEESNEFLQYLHSNDKKEQTEKITPSHSMQYIQDDSETVSDYKGKQSGDNTKEDKDDASTDPAIFNYNDDNIEPNTQYARLIEYTESNFSYTI